MNFRSTLIAGYLLFAISSFSSDEIFTQAQTAYDDGHYSEAYRLYENLLHNGISNYAVEYNLANAYFKNGNLPQAVLHYRRAWYDAPRDPDIRANMHFALNAAGAVEPITRFVDRLFNMLSKNAWIMIAIVGYLIFTLLIILGMLIRPAKRILIRISLLPAAIILISAGGWRNWHQLQTNPEWVVMKTGATALFGPMEGTTAHYNIPLASIVRQRNTDPKGWVEVEYDGNNGWLNKEYIDRVSP